MSFKTNLIVAPLLLLPSPAIAVPEPMELKPSSRWLVHQEQEFCRLARSFGEGEHRVTIIFERQGTEDLFRLILKGKRMRQKISEEAIVTFGEGGDPQRSLFFYGTMGDDPMWFLTRGLRLVAPPPEWLAQVEKNPGQDDPELAPVTPEQEMAVRQIKIGRPLIKPIVLATGSLGSAFAAFRRCTDEVMSRWGIDLEKHRDLQRRTKPAGSPARWLTDNDYPTSMRVKGLQGFVDFRLIVGVDGSVEDCRIQQSTHPDGFHKAVCDNVKKRARFSPALDRDGQPIRSFYRNRVRFQL